MELMVSIIVPCFNQSHYLNDALESIMRQTYRHWECIVIDDGSTDNTAIISKQWIDKDDRFKYIYQSNQGLSAARNAGIDAANGDFIQFLDADDILLPVKLEKQVQDLKPILSQLKLCFSYTNYYFGEAHDIYNFSTDTVSPEFNFSNETAELISRWETTLTIPCNAFLFSTTIFKENKIRFDTTLPNHEDIDCWLNVFKLSPQIFYTNERLCVYRKYEGSMSKNMKLMGEGFLQVINKHMSSIAYTEREISLLQKKRRKVLQKYKRFDLMNTYDKINSIKAIANYYTKRLLQKISIAK